MDYSLYEYGRPTLVMSSGPDRVVRDEPADENTRLPRPVGFAYQNTELSPFGPVAMYGRSAELPPVRHMASGTVCADPDVCHHRHHRPKHRADVEQVTHPLSPRGKCARVVTR